MEFKVRGNVVLFDALEIKKASNLIVSNDNNERFTGKFYFYDSKNRS